MGFPSSSPARSGFGRRVGSHTRKMSSTLTLLLILAACGKDAIPTSPNGPEQNQLVSVVRVQPSAAVIEPDAQVGLAAIVSSARGRTVNGRPVQWSSSDERVAYVDSQGRIVAGEEGTATITANVLGVTGAATIDVRGTVTGIVIDEPLFNLVEGGQERLTATLIYSNGATRPARGLRWWSESPDRLWIDGDGDAFGRRIGDVDIRISGRGQQGSKRVKVKSGGVSQVTVTATKTDLVVGETAHVWATVLNSQGKRVSRQVSWASSDPSVVSVNSVGQLLAGSVGTAVITGTADGVSGNASITVQASAGGGGGGGGSVTLPETITDLAIGTREERRVQLRFTEVDDGSGSPASYELRYALASGFQWGSALVVEKGTCASPMSGSAPGTTRSCWAEGLVAGEDYAFQVVAYRPGDDTYGSPSNVVTVTTLDPSILIDVTPSAFEIETGDTRTVNASIVDSYGNDVGGTPSWTTTRSSVASLTSSGSSAIVTGVSPGQATIRATALGVAGGSDAIVMAPIADDSGGSDDSGSSGAGTGGGGTGAPPPPPAGQHFVGDFSSFTSDAALHAHAGTTTPLNVHAEPGVGMRYDFIARPNHCNDHSLASLVSLPSGTREVWIRFRIRFSSNWTTVNSNCSSPAPDYKTILTWMDAKPPSGSRRFDFKLGKGGDQMHASVPGFAPADAVPLNVVQRPGADALFDGTWHTVELHHALIGDDRALTQVRIDGVVTHNYDSATTSGLASRWLQKINIGANRNLGATEPMNIWWDDFEVWVGSVDPGFAFPSPTRY